MPSSKTSALLLLLILTIPTFVPTASVCLLFFDTFPLVYVQVVSAFACQRSLTSVCVSRCDQAIAFPRRDDDGNVLRSGSETLTPMLELRSRKPLRILSGSQHTCDHNEHRCVNGLCILPKWLCDGLDDCGDFSDEIACPNQSGCPDDRFDCGNGQCVTRSFVCDGERDCLNGADETDCRMEEASNSVTACASSQFACRDLQCIPRSLACNRQTDCRDGSDEEGCVYCFDEQFACRSRQTNRTLKCVPDRYVCDGVNDCDDGSDEESINCAPSSHQLQ